MATAETDSRNFVIDAKADRLLGELSRDLSDLILRIAVSQTTNRTRANIPLVDACDISAASAFLCQAFSAAIESGKVSADSRETADALLKFCQIASVECIGDVNKSR